MIYLVPGGSIVEHSPDSAKFIEKATLYPAPGSREDRNTLKYDVTWGPDSVNPKSIERFGKDGKRIGVVISE